MIIECPACSKKFNIDEKLIPDEGRLLKCGNCDHTWFFKKEENIKLETETTKINEIEENKLEINIEPVKEPIKQTKKIKKISKKSSTKISKSKELVSIDKSSVSRENNIIKKIFLIIISIIAFILLLDTFKNQISVIFPGILKLSDSLSLVINDLKLFIKDLVR